MYLSLHSYELYAKNLLWSSITFWWEGANQQKGNAINLSNVHAIEWITKNYKEFDILVTQGAGTISQLNNSIKEKWALKK